MACRCGWRDTCPPIPPPAGSPPPCSKTPRFPSATSSSTSTPPTILWPTRSRAARPRPTPTSSPTAEPAPPNLSARLWSTSTAKAARCPRHCPFALSQSASTSPATGGASTSFTFGLTRGEGQQYLSKLSTMLPPGLVGKIPAVTLCGEPQAAAGNLLVRQSDRHGRGDARFRPHPAFARAASPTSTGPYGGAPYGLTVVVPAEKIGPYDYGRIVTRAAINVDPYTARMVVSSQLPTIVGGAPLRLRSLSVNVNRPNFTINPTNCVPLTTDTTLTSTFGATQALSSPFQASGLRSARLQPQVHRLHERQDLAARTAPSSSSKSPTRRRPGEHQVGARALPKQLPSRMSTLEQGLPGGHLRTPTRQPVQRCRRSARPRSLRLCCPASSPVPRCSSPTAAPPSPISTWCSAATASR